MRCSLCQRDAVDRCYSCGQLFCEDHGAKNCVKCQNAIVEGDPSPERVSAARQQGSAVAAWWRPQPADEYKPPACYVCHGLTRAVCRECGRNFCAEHAGTKLICKACVPQSDPSFYIIGGFLLVFAAILLIVAVVG